MKTQKTDKFGRPVWVVILKNGQRFTASGSREEVRKLFADDGTIDDLRCAGGLLDSDTRVSQIRARKA
jgi:hypothetical protein